MRRWLNDTPLTNPVERRLAPLVQLVLMALGITVLIALALRQLLTGFSPIPSDSLVITFGFLLGLLVVLVIVRRGNFKTAAWLLVALIFITSARSVVNAQGAVGALMILFVPLVIAGLLLNRWTLWGVFLLSTVLLASIQSLQANASVAALQFVVVGGLVTFLLDQMGGTLRDELTSSLIRNREVEQAREALETHASELFKANERLTVTLKSIGDGVITTDFNGHVMLINDVAQQLTGWSQAEAYGQPLSKVFRIINEYTRETVESPVDRVLREGIIVGLANHTLLIAKDGREIPIDDSGAPIPDPSGGISGVVLVFRDITERKQAESAQAWLAAIVESSDDVIISKTLQGMITSWNFGAERVFGYTAEEAVGQPVTMLFPPEIVDEEQYILARLAMGERVAHYETVRVHKNGQHIPISLTISPIKDPSGRVIGASKIARDITRQKEAEVRELEMAAVNERHRLARDLHDAVSQVLFSANVIAESLPRLWARSPERALEQVGLLLHLTRGAAAEMRTLLLELRPENIVSTKLSLLLTQLGNALQARKAVTVSSDINEIEELTLPEDVHVALYRIAQESFNNIAKHSNAQNVRVRLNSQPDRVEIIIVDNGRGFDPGNGLSGFGLTSMQERAASIGASLLIQSRVGLGTRVKLVWQSEAEVPV